MVGRRLAAMVRQQAGMGTQQVLPTGLPLRRTMGPQHSSSSRRPESRTEGAGEVQVAGEAAGQVRRRAARRACSPLGTGPVAAA